MIVDNIEIGGNGTFTTGVANGDHGYTRPQALDYTINGKSRLIN